MPDGFAAECRSSGRCKSWVPWTMKQMQQLQSGPQSAHSEPCSSCVSSGPAAGSINDSALTAQGMPPLKGISICTFQKTGSCYFGIADSGVPLGVKEGVLCQVPLCPAQCSSLGVNVWFHLLLGKENEQITYTNSKATYALTLHPQNHTGMRYIILCFILSRFFFTY